ncbi:meiosis-specific nuclear structural protein 1-like [Pelobates fuscus]|uniref:meiosis-specific nuclear structural protein 1-like n=1 Tax=Pelobates fuscus TaxID=191477 RepID=UPI002FE43BC4
MMSSWKNMIYVQWEKVVAETQRRQGIRGSEKKTEQQMETNVKSEENAEKKRFVKRLQERVQERRMEESIQRTAEEKLLREWQLQQEQQMVRDLAAKNYEKLKDETMRQQIRENSRLMRELQQKVKERAAQLAEKEPKPKITTAEEKKLKEQQLEQEQRVAWELAKINQKKLQDEKTKQRMQTDCHLIDELKEKLKERAAHVAEKELLKHELTNKYSEIARKIKEENKRPSEKALIKQTRHYQGKLLYQSELERQLEEKELKKQDVYEEFLREKLLVDEIVRKIFEEDLMERQLKLQKMNATKRYIKEFKEQQITWRKMESEKMEEENRKILAFAMANVRDGNSKKALREMLANHIQREQQQREKLEKMYEKLYVEEQAVEARQRDIEQELQEIQEEERREALRRAIVEEERQKLLKQHAAKLFGYLPKGIFKYDSNLDTYDEELCKTFRERRAAMFPEQCWES